MTARVRRRVGGSRVARATAARLRTVLGAEGIDAPADAGVDELRGLVAALIADEGADAVWLTAATLRAAMPSSATTWRLQRRAELDGPAAVLAEIEAGIPPATLEHWVRIARATTLVDVHQLVRSPFTTGIQRVTREVVARWARDHTLELVRWTDDFTAIRPLLRAEYAAALGSAEAPRDGAPTVVVPWRAHYVLPEVALDPERTLRMQSLALHSRSVTTAIVFDLVPVTAAETAETGVPSDFSHQLAALRHFDRVAAISGATRQEYEGWRMMLAAIGVEGPEVRTVPLPAEARPSSADELAAARARYTIPTVPLVMCVGSHEPRKNHLAVLQAAELLWRDGHRFSLLFVGGNSWGSAPFRRWVAELASAGRPVETVDAIADAELWALYRLARCTVFPSFSEGFGLPVVESLVCGTPVVTSDLGAMREVAADGGALCVDPRDHHSIARAVASLLTDDALHAGLSGAARSRPPRTWDDYAAEAWRVLGTGP